MLPNGASFTDASPELTFQDENTDSDVIASLSYTYNEEPVGTADISLTKDNLQEFTFDKETDSDETADTDGTEKPIQQTHFIKINVRMILIVAGILLLLFLLYRLLRHLMKTFRFSIHLPKLHRRRARSVEDAPLSPDPKPEQKISIRKTGITGRRRTGADGMIWTCKIHYS